MIPMVNRHKVIRLVPHHHQLVNFLDLKQIRCNTRIVSQIDLICRHNYLTPGRQRDILSIRETNPAFVFFSFKLQPD